MWLSMLLLLPCMAAATAAIHVAHERRSIMPLISTGAPVPIINNAFTFFVLLRHNPHRALARLAKTYGPIFL
ncbi:hypothetical protein HU200_052376 [Digitaria exilis]|uniref:Uncharacterized protein n=1 Tax=Digitaria exilis TaxID=1010633 RepID=A0A835AU47_9POAL|nr:hypothetical protein HU200_052376 [Digitaria exilis]